jgi:hypothetical protein
VFFGHDKSSLQIFDMPFFDKEIGKILDFFFFLGSIIILTNFNNFYKILQKFGHKKLQKKKTLSQLLTYRVVGCRFDH